MPRHTGLCRPPVDLAMVDPILYNVRYNESSENQYNKNVKRHVSTSWEVA